MKWTKEKAQAVDGFIKFLVTHRQFILLSDYPTEAKWKGDLDELKGGLVLAKVYLEEKGLRLFDEHEPFGIGIDPETAQGFLKNGGFVHVYEQQGVDDAARLVAQGVNSSVIKTNRFVRYTGIGSIVFAALAAWIAYLQYAKPDVITSQDLKELKTDILKISTERPKRDTVYILNPPVLPSPSSKK